MNQTLRRRQAKGVVLNELCGEMRPYQSEGDRSTVLPERRSRKESPRNGTSVNAANNS